MELDLSTQQTLSQGRSRWSVTPRSVFLWHFREDFSNLTHIGGGKVLGTQVTIYLEVIL